MTVIVEWDFDPAGSVSNTVVLPHDTWFAFYERELVGYIERLPLSILECTDWQLSWYCNGGVAKAGVDLGVHLTLEEVQDRWVQIFADGIELQATIDRMQPRG